MLFLDSARFERFFIEAYYAPYSKKTFLKTADDGSTLAIVGTSDRETKRLGQFFEQHIDGLHERFAAVLEELCSSAHPSPQAPDALSFIVFYIDHVHNRLWWFNRNMPPLLIRSHNHGLVELTDRGSDLGEIPFNKPHSFFYPLEDVITLLAPSNELGSALFRKAYRTIFSKKDILRSFKTLGEDLLSSDQRFAFIFANFQLDQNLEFTRHYRIKAKISEIEKIELDLENILDNYFQGGDSNTKAVTVINEFLMNAYEHGVLRIDSETKQKLMEEGRYESYLHNLEESSEGKIDLQTKFYRNGIFEVTIKDHGQGFNLRRELVEAGDSDYRGRGIMMSSAIADAVFFSDNGSTVTFYIKFNLEKQRVDSKTRNSARAMLQELEVLYVEDETVIRQLFEGLIRRHVKTLHVAKDGEEAMELFEQHRPHIIVTDIKMPKMDGLELSRTIKKISPETPIILTTAHDRDDFLKESIEIGIDKFLTKPVDTGKLRHVLHQLASTIYFRTQDSEEQDNLAELRNQQAYHQSQLAQAHEKQKLIIHDDSDRFQHLRCSAFYKPLEVLSGDIYGIHRTEPGVSVAFIIDCMDKGVVASVSAIASATYLNRSIQMAVERGEFDFTQLITEYVRYIQSYLLEEECLSFSLALIDCNRHVLQYCSFGMYPILIRNRDDQTVQTARAPHPPLMPYDQDISVLDVSLPQAFDVLLYSDGICEFENFTYPQFYEAVTNTDDYAALIEAVDQVVGLEQPGNLHDDITLIYVTHQS